MKHRVSSPQSGAQRHGEAPAGKHQPPSAYSQATSTVEIAELIERLRLVEEKGEALAKVQHELKEQLAAAIQIAAAVYHKSIEELNDVGGEC